MSVSLGGPRIFQMRRRNEPGDTAVAANFENVRIGAEGGREDVITDADTTMSVSLEPGSALLMAGDTQEHWLHRLPDTGAGMPVRMSLTYRSIQAKYEDNLAKR
mmetsp:Transcript_13074/g.25037  ORF Transcript_13074/g.25037 Transcript_13074/m.25037 type:complete len:104 (+) Transcript_13074:978-1289(+)